MRYTVMFLVVVLGVSTLFTATGCSLVQNTREEIYEHSMKVFDEVDYRYHRKGNEITRELMATGTEKIVPDDNLQLPTP